VVQLRPEILSTSPKFGPIAFVTEEANRESNQIYMLGLIASRTKPLCLTVPLKPMPFLTSVLIAYTERNFGLNVEILCFMKTDVV